MDVDDGNIVVETTVTGGAATDEPLNITSAQYNREFNNRAKFINMYKKIDQPSLFKVGLYEKQALSEQAVDQVYGFSMLQRFRQSKDLN